MHAKATLIDAKLIILIFKIQDNAFLVPLSALILNSIAHGVTHVYQDPVSVIQVSTTPNLPTHVFPFLSSVL
jgi:hypothetical protein